MTRVTKLTKTSRISNHSQPYLHSLRVRGARAPHAGGCAVGCRLGCLLLALGLLALCPLISGSGPEEKATRPQVQAQQDVPLTRYIPATVQLFVHVPRLGTLERALSRGQASRLLPYLDPSPEGHGGAVELRRGLLSLLGPDSEVNPADLVRLELGIVASSWSALDEAIWLVRLPDAGAVDRWFPSSKREAEHQRETRGLRFFRTPERVFVCVRDDVMALARQGPSGNLLRDTMRVMAGRRGAVLEDAEVCEALVRQLEPGYLATVYFARDAGEVANDPGGFSLWPACTHGVVAAYERAGWLDFSFRARRLTPESSISVEAEAIARMRRLPRSTLVASAVPLELNVGLARVSGPERATDLGLTMQLLRTVLAGPEGARSAEAQLGDQAVLLWGQDLRVEGNAPQFAVLIECGGGDELAERLAYMAARTLRVVAGLEGEQYARQLEIKRTSHFGTTIHYVPLEEFPAQASHPAVSLLGRLRPAFAVSRGWLIVALDPEHMRRIIDADKGLAPTLDDEPGFGPFVWWRGEATAVALAQPTLAAGVLEQWLVDLREGAPSLLDPALWEQPMSWARPRGKNLGIGMRSRQDSGVVVVARVYPDTLASDVLMVGDRIVAVDGHILDLDTPNASLRAQLAESETEPGARLRVHRQGGMVDVQLPGRFVEPTPLSSPAEMIGELAEFSRLIGLATFAVERTEPEYYGFRLSLRPQS